MSKPNNLPKDNVASQRVTPQCVAPQRVAPQRVAPQYIAPLEVIIISGPTASGKSDIALSLAELWNAEIISADSMKVYRQMDVGTAKPSEEDKKRAQHHLIDIRNPWERYSAYDFLHDADLAAKEIRARGKNVIIEGGTPLYIKGFLEGLLECGPIEPELRSSLEDEADTNGVAFLHARLAKCDPVTAGRIHPMDKRRIVRALEVYLSSGIPISELQQQAGLRRAHINSHFFAINRDRELLKSRMNLRLGKMLSSGFIEEAAHLLKIHKNEHKISQTAIAALGYRTLWQHLGGEISRERAQELIANKTWRFIRSQLTWLRSFTDVIWFDASDDSALDAKQLLDASIK